MRFLTHILTGRDNQTYDIARVGIFLALAIISAESFYGLYAVRQMELDKLGGFLRDFAVAAANILGWGSVGCAVKAKTEPDSQNILQP